MVCKRFHEVAYFMKAALALADLELVSSEMIADTVFTKTAYACSSSIKLRLSDAITWIYESDADNVEVIKRNARLGWEKLTKENGGFDLTTLGHPAIAYRARNSRNFPGLAV